jgi:hypothetical protein
MANTSPRRGSSKTLYLLDAVKLELKTHSEATNTSESAIVAEALAAWFAANPVDPARRRLIDERRALEQKLRQSRVEEMGIEPRVGARRAPVALATRRRAA